jgi:hypothetical protein
VTVVARDALLSFREGYVILVRVEFAMPKCHAGACHAPALPRGNRGNLCNACDNAVDELLARRRARIENDRA